MAAMTDMTPELIKLVEPSIVQVLSRDQGLGVISNGYIFTAAHCLDVDFEGDIALGEFRYQKCRSPDGQDFLAGNLFVDAVSDLAVLCCPDGQNAPKQSDEYELAVGDRGLELYLGPYPQVGDEPMTINLRNIDGWVAGKLSNVWNGRADVETTQQMLGGASGGPIINSAGKLVAINSHYSEITKEFDCLGRQPMIQEAWPVWLAKELAIDE